MAKYLILIYGDEQQWATMPAEEMEKLYAAHRAFSAAAGSAILHGEELQPASVATTVRANAAGRVVTTDGPFLETKEALGGYYVIEADDLDQVVKLAEQLYEASAGHSGIEIRMTV